MGSIGAPLSTLTHIHQCARIQKTWLSIIFRLFAVKLCYRTKGKCVSSAAPHLSPLLFRSYILYIFDVVLFASFVAIFHILIWNVELWVWAVQRAATAAQNKEDVRGNVTVELRSSLIGSFDWKLRLNRVIPNDTQKWNKLTRMCEAAWHFDYARASFFRTLRSPTSHCAYSIASHCIA